MKFIKWLARKPVKEPMIPVELQDRSLRSIEKKKQVAERVIQMMENLKIERRIEDEHHVPERRLGAF